MQLNKTDFLRKAQHPLLLALASLPVSMLVILPSVPDLFRWCWCFPAAALLAAWVCLLIPGKRRLLAGIFFCVMLAASAAFLLPWQTHIVLLLLPAMYIALLLGTLPIGGWPYNRELSVGWHVSGGVTHVLLQFLVNGFRMSGNGIYDAAQTPLLLSFLAYSVLVLLALNRASLDSAAQSRRKVPLLMRRQNLILTIALMIVGVAVAAIPAIGTLLSRVWDYIMHGIALLMALLSALMPQQSAGGGAPAGGDMGDMGFGEANPPSALAMLMEKILTVITLAALVVGALLLVRVICKKLWQLFRYLLNRMQQYSAAASEDYEDEITSTRDEADTEREGLIARLRRTSPDTEKGGTPAQRVRMRYKRLKQRHTSWSAASTARETLPAEAAALYERIRYGGEAITEEEAIRFKENTKKV